MPQSGKLPVLNLLRQKNQVFRPTGVTRCTDSRQTWHGQRARRSAWHLAVQNFTSIGAWVWESGPQNIKKIPLLVKSRLAWANLLTNVWNFGGFYMPNYPSLAFNIWHDSLHRLRSYCWETVHWSIRLNFSVHPVGLTPFWWSRRALSPCKLCGRSYIFVDAKIWCLSVCL